MDEASAKDWLVETLNVPRETLERLQAFVALIREENSRQNLVSKQSLEHIWTRHVVDSAQLIRWAKAGEWTDLGTGAGFPGLIVALLRNDPVTLVEERRLRADFLGRAVEALGLAHNTTVICGKVERLGPRVSDTISARAFAPLERLLHVAEPISDISTRWILPKGRNAQSELEAASASWQGDFSLEPSLTDPDAQIIVAEGVRRRPTGRRGR